MATDGSHRVKMEKKSCDHTILFILIGSSLFLQITRTIIQYPMGSKFSKIRLRTTELAAIERLEKSKYNDVTTLAPLFLIGSSSFLQVTRTAIKSWMGLKFGQIILGTVEFAALEHQEKSPDFTMGELL